MRFDTCNLKKESQFSKYKMSVMYVVTVHCHRESNIYSICNNRIFKEEVFCKRYTLTAGAFRSEHYLVTSYKQTILSLQKHQPVIPPS